MVYTITLNPSIDYLVSVPYYKSGVVNRATKEEIYPGGKGINVSIVLNNLNIPNKALGFIAGFTGIEIEKQLKEFGCSTDFVTLSQGVSRMNIKIKSTEESEINGQGPDIKEMDLKKLYSILHAVKDGDFIVIAGSIPGTLPDNIYEEIIKNTEDKKIYVIVDASGNALKNTLKYRPFLVKPNEQELGDLFGIIIQTEEECICYAKKLQEFGARNVMVSRAEEGAILLTEEKDVYVQKAPIGKAINAVGAGDSMVAGFIAGYINTMNYLMAFQMAVAAGSASAFSNWLPSKQEVLQLLPKE